MIGDGIRLIPATDAHFAELNRTMREEDRAECRVFGDGNEHRENWEAAFAAYKGDDLLCITGWFRFKNMAESSHIRCLATISTVNVERYKLAYARQSLRVVHSLEAMMTNQVTDLFAFPMASYKRAVDWLNRVVGMREVNEVKLRGITHKVMHKKREVLWERQED